MPTSTSDPARVVAELRARAHALGFEAFGIAAADSRPDLPDKLRAALAAGWHGDMDWMEETAARRGDPRELWPEVRSVVMLGMNYGPDSDPLATLAQADRGSISVYARNRDYHDIIKGRLKELAGVLHRRTGAEVKVFVDTAPVMEKPLAQAAGLGWQGKNTVLISRELGAWLFLGAIFTDAALPTDQVEVDHCGSCSRCLDACPTAAFPAPFQLDSRRCLAYLTIEHKGPIPREFRRPMGNRIYGCDDCLAVCPWNKFARAAGEMKLRAREELGDLALADLLQLDDGGFRALFAGSPIKRIGHARFLRNVLVAAGNSADGKLVPLVRDLLQHPEPLVRGAAVWALGELAPFIRDGLQAEALRCETDADVRAEWASTEREAA